MEKMNENANKNIGKRTPSTDRDTEQATKPRQKKSRKKFETPVGHAKTLSLSLPHTFLKNPNQPLLTHKKRKSHTHTLTQKKPSSVGVCLLFLFF
jgi:hypothetical protein